LTLANHPGKVALTMVRVRTDFPFRVKVIEHTLIPMGDGVRLAARMWMPENAGPLPALLEYLPYRKRDGTRARDNGVHEFFAGHGYVSIRLDIRGSGDSEGLIDDEYTVQEQLDGCAAIAWIAAQAWCDGNVAMFGISWGGFNALQIAARRPPALKTIITVGSTDDRYATDVHYVGGCLSKDNFDWAATMMAHNDLPPDPQLAGAQWRAMWTARMHHASPWILTWLVHQRRDDYWKQGSVCEDFSAIDIPVYAVSGWADNYSEAVPRLLAGLTCPRKGLIGPWAHSYPHDVAVQPAIGWLQEALRWFDHWLKGQDTGIMNEPMYRVWMQESVRPQTCYLERKGRWVAEEAWPSPRIAVRKLYLTADGKLSESMGHPSRVSVCSPLWVGMAAGEVGRYGEDAEWPTDQREDDGGSLVFVSVPLAEHTEILGAPQLHLTFSCDKPQGLVCVRLNDVSPDGASTRVCVGLLNLTHRDSHETPKALTPGETYTCIADLDDIAHAFPAGHRIAVSISTTYWPIAWPSPDLATVTVACGSSFLTLPVRPLRAEDVVLAPFEEPEHAPQSPLIVHDYPSPHRRRVTRDLLSGEMMVDFPRWTYKREFPEFGQTQTSEALARYTISDGDPLSAKVETDYRVEMARTDATLVHHSKGQMTCDATHFIVDIGVAITEDGVPVFERRWQERIKRDMV
jgi:uncharacterized protein